MSPGCNVPSIDPSRWLVPEKGDALRRDGGNIHDILAREFNPEVVLRAVENER